MDMNDFLANVPTNKVTRCKSCQAPMSWIESRFRMPLVNQEIQRSSAVIKQAGIKAK
jgi:hypothetical protein